MQGATKQPAIIRLDAEYHVLVGVDAGYDAAAVSFATYTAVDAWRIYLEYPDRCCVVIGLVFDNCIGIDYM